MSTSPLKKKAISGMIWSGLQKYSTIFIQFISGIILARLLTPYDYGCIGMLLIFMVLAEAFIDGGFGSALIQKKNPTQEDYSTIFYWNLAVAAIMYFILYVSAPAISRFYDIPLLCSVLRVQGIVLFLYAFNIVQHNLLKKQLRFKILSIVTVSSSIIALGVTVFLAYSGFGVWALVTQNIIIVGIPAIVYWLVIKWRPSWLFSWKSFRSLFSFGFYMFLTHLINQFGTQLQGLLIGKVYNPSTMGYYTKAIGTERLASTSISSVMTQVTYPLYAEAQDDKKSLANMIRRMTMTLAYVTFPLMFILMLCAKPLFVMLYSDRWLQSVPYFQVLCLAGLAGCLQAVNLQAISAIGKSRVMFIWTVVKRVVGIGFVVVGLVFWGMKGLLAGMVLNYWFSYFVNISLVSIYIGYNFWHQIKDLLPIAIASSLAAVATYFIAKSFHLGMYPDGILKLLVYAALYLGWSLLFKPEAYSYSTTLIPAVRSHTKRKKIVNENSSD